MYSVETVPVSDVVGNNDTVGPLVVARSDCLKAFLAGSIPNLQFADLFIAIDRSNFEVHANCRHEVFLELVVLAKNIDQHICRELGPSKENRLLGVLALMA